MQDRILRDAFEPLETDREPEPHEVAQALHDLPDPVLFIRATCDALAEWLEERAEEVDGSTRQTQWAGPGTPGPT